MRKHPALFLSAAVLSLAFAPAPPPRPAPNKEEMKKLEGTWALISYANGGKVLLGEEGQATVLFEGGRMTLFLGRRVNGRWKVAVDATKRPRALDASQGDIGHPKQFLAAYALAGDSLTICHALGTAERPRDLTSQAPGHWLMVLRRQKR